MPIENKPHRASPSAPAHLDGLRPSGCNGVRRMSRRPETLIQAQNEIEIFVLYTAKPPNRELWAFCGTSGNLCLHGNAWWRTQSQSNLSQRQNSLLTGKITGNFADSGLNPQFWWRVSWRIQSLKAKFPAKRNREFFRRIRELISKNRELQLPKSNFRYNRSAWILRALTAALGKVLAFLRQREALGPSSTTTGAHRTDLQLRENQPAGRCLGAPAEMVPSSARIRKLRIGKPFRRIGGSAW
jgi:hypothetical protein